MSGRYCWWLNHYFANTGHGRETGNEKRPARNRPRFEAEWRQLGTKGRGRPRNSRADWNVSGCQPSHRINSSSDSRTEMSSSTTKASFRRKTLLQLKHNILAHPQKSERPSRPFAEPPNQPFGAVNANGVEFCAVMWHAVNGNSKPANMSIARERIRVLAQASIRDGRACRDRLQCPRQPMLSQSEAWRLVLPAWRESRLSSSA